MADLTLAPDAPATNANGTTTTTISTTPPAVPMGLPINLRITHTIDKRDIIYTIAMILLIAAGIKTLLMLINFLLQMPIKRA